MDGDAVRGRTLLEESREAVVLLDDADRVIGASRRARQSIDGLREGERIPDGLLSGDAGIIPLVVPYEVGGRRERLVYLSRSGDLTAYDELRAGFTAAVSHELRTPLARLMSLLETAALPGEDPEELIDRAKLEVEQIGELIDDVLFLSELETGRQVVALAKTPVRAVAEEVAISLGESADRADVTLRVVLENLVANSIRYAGPGARCRVSAEQRDGVVRLIVADDGQGVGDEDLA